MRLRKNTPRWELEDAHRRAQEAYRLLAEDRALIEPRLPPGAVDAFRADLDALAEAGVERIGDLMAQKGATGGNADLAREGHAVVMIVREQLRRQAPGAAELHRAVGVGDNLRPHEVIRVLANLDQIVAQAGAGGDALVPYGVTVADVAEATRLADALRAKKRAQHARKTARARGTDDRHALQLRVESAIDRIGTAGKMEFRRDAVKRARYHALFTAAQPALELEPEPAIARIDRAERAAPLQLGPHS
jgi:hypothetical protein